MLIRVIAYPQNKKCTWASSKQLLTIWKDTCLQKLDLLLGYRVYEITSLVLDTAKFGKAEQQSCSVRSMINDGLQSQNSYFGRCKNVSSTENK